MRKKVLISVITTILFSLIVISSLFIVISNYQHIENTKHDLKVNSKIIAKIIDNNGIKNTKALYEEVYDKFDMRITYMDSNGEIVYDSTSNNEHIENHKDRKEVKEALSNGSGSSVRFSNTAQKNMIYYAEVLSNGNILRIAIPLDDVNMLKDDFLRYYVICFIIVIIMAVILSSKISDIIVEPIKELQFVTGKIATGEFNRRVNIKSNDEIGKLASTFNNMADKLQITLKEVIDKQNRLEAILKSMDSGVIAVDRKHKIIMMNPYAKKIFGINRDIIGENLMDNIRDFEFEKVFSEHKYEYKEIKILWPIERELRIKTADIINEGKLIGTVAVVQDITDIKKLENMRSQFVANVSHELKTPLTSIKGFAETLKYVNDEENKEKFLNIINDEAERLTRLINDILALSDLEYHKDEIVQDIYVKESLEELGYIMESVAESKSVDLSIKCDKNILLRGSKDKFKQMMINLIDNAIKYSEKGAKVFVEAIYMDNECTITIKDTGMGIDEEHLPRVFERFYRVDKARSRANGGTGLGLAIVKHIVITFNGTINVESELGVGTLFTIKIPAKVYE